MRLFTGISLPESILYTLEAFLAPLRALASIRWSPLPNLHITTKFIGEWPEERLDELVMALAAVRSVPFPIRLQGLGWFPSAQAPHVFWMGIAQSDPLVTLAASTDSACVTLGCGSEQRAYHPHLTLARTRRESRLTALRQALDSLQLPAVPEFTASDFHLYQSDSGVYRKLHTFALSEFVRSIK